MRSMSFPPYRFAVASVALALICSALPVGAQRASSPPQSRPTFRANVELIQVEVVAVDDRGQPVTGLTAGDFRLLDAGEPRDIALFEEVAPATRAADAVALPRAFPRDVASNRDPGASRLVVLAIDDMVPGDRWESIEALGREVVQQIGDRAAVSLVFTSGAPRIEATTDHARVLRAIDLISERTHERPRVARIVRNETGSCAFDLLAGLGRALERDDHQRKALIYISPYCGLTAGVENEQKAREMLDARRLANVALAGADPDGRVFARQSGVHAFGAGGVDGAEMVDALRRANVAFYGIDPRGPVSYSLGNFPPPHLFNDVSIPGPAGGAWRPTMQAGIPWTTRMFDPVLNSQTAFREATEATGGFAVTDDRRFSEGIGRIISDFTSHYVVGFYPGEPSSREYRPLELTTSRPGLTLRYRRGYVSGIVERRDSGTEDPVLALTETVLPRADLPLRLTAAVVPAGGKRSAVALTIEVATPDGTAAPAADDLDLRIVAVDLDAARVADTFSRTANGGVSSAPVPGDARAASGAPSRYQITTAVDLEPGRYQLRVAARSAALDAAGSVYGMVDVPKPGKREVHLGGPTLERAAVAAARLTLAVADRVPSFTPVLDRAFAADTTVRIVVPYWHGAASGAFGAWVELSDRHGRRIRRETTHVAAGVATGALDVRVPLAGLAPGAYIVRVGAGEDPAAATSDVGIVVTASSRR